MKMDLKEIRIEIDKIDREIIKLFQKRLDLVNKVAKYKRENNLEIVDGNREREILENLNGEKYCQELKDLYREIFNISKGYQKNI